MGFILTNSFANLIQNKIRLSSLIFFLQHTLRIDSVLNYRKYYFLYSYKKFRFLFVSYYLLFFSGRVAQVIHTHPSRPNLFHSGPPEDSDDIWPDPPAKSRKLKRKRKSSSSEEHHKPKKSKKTKKKKLKKSTKKVDSSPSSSSSSETDSDSCLGGRLAAKKLLSGADDIKKHPDWVFVPTPELSANRERLITEINVSFFIFFFLYTKISH